MFLRIVILGAVMLLLAALISEVLIPLFRGTQFFPHLRKSPAREKIVEVQAELEESEEEMRLAEMRKELSERRARLNPNEGAPSSAGYGGDGGGPGGGKGGAPGQPGEAGKSATVDPAQYSN